jgi:hypothetical protein
MKDLKYRIPTQLEDYLHHWDIATIAQRNGHHATMPKPVGLTINNVTQSGHTPVWHNT